VTVFPYISRRVNQVKRELLGIAQRSPGKNFIL